MAADPMLRAESVLGERCPCCGHVLENRRTGDGARLGPKSDAEMAQSYDEKQARPREGTSLADVAGRLIDGP